VKERQTDRYTDRWIGEMSGGRGTTSVTLKSKFKISFQSWLPFLDINPPAPNPSSQYIAGEYIR
jgi:hypothetical protein